MSKEEAAKKHDRKVLEGMDPRTSAPLDEELEKTFWRRRPDAWMVNEEDNHIILGNSRGLWTLRSNATMT
jgi:hypothetical protein